MGRPDAADDPGTEPDGRGRHGRTWRLVAGIVAWPRLLAAQNVTQQFTYDNLRVSGLQADLGALAASKLRGTVVGGVRLDIGQVAPSVRVLLGLSYDRGELDQHTTADL